MRQVQLPPSRSLAELEQAVSDLRKSWIINPEDSQAEIDWKAWCTKVYAIAERESSDPKEIFFTLMHAIIGLKDALREISQGTLPE